MLLLNELLFILYEETTLAALLHALLLWGLIPDRGAHSIPEHAMWPFTPALTHFVLPPFTFLPFLLTLSHLVT